MKKIKDAVFLFVASACGLGLMPVAPGSFGALLGVAIHLACVRWVAPGYQLLALFVALFAVSAAHYALTPWAQRHWRDDDPGNFVLDEVAGYLVVPIVVRTGPVWFVALAGFLLFRVLDIIKIPPASQIDQTMHDAWGVLLDDLVSGLYAAGLVWLALYFFFPA
jgi:phosphatidylglycerophosphatase A